jgi:hypothetical protein
VVVAGRPVAPTASTQCIKVRAAKFAHTVAPLAQKVVPLDVINRLPYAVIVQSMVTGIKLTSGKLAACARSVVGDWAWSSVAVCRGGRRRAVVSTPPPQAATAEGAQHRGAGTEQNDEFERGLRVGPGSLVKHGHQTIRKCGGSVGIGGLR